MVRGREERLNGKVSVRKKTSSWLCVTALLAAACTWAQSGVLTRELLIQYTPEWHGERLSDGRPKVPDDILRPYDQNTHSARA